MAFIRFGKFIKTWLCGRIKSIGTGISSKIPLLANFAWDSYYPGTGWIVESARGRSAVLHLILAGLKACHPEQSH